ncbi:MULTISPECIES: MFS transporter [Cellulomonas]|uniref:MFS transporter n=1 Tax=Cellulomonas gelida TaxID=1712 RepID=A0A4Y3KJ23_9CELL|nr:MULTISPECIES: MFS transporter [Cellulomonas]MCR6706042.1 MFS transporter [Cellulomonas sp.]GEA83992.1 MFS transporter [Cellulomonas gelida]GGL27743.1 MFS transporter [Cellulomonas gelida]
MPAVVTDDARATWARLRTTTWAMCALVFLAAFESLAVTTVMPTVSLELDGAALYAVAFAAPLASGVVGMVAAGAWADRVGPARPLLAAALAFVAGLLVAGTAPTMAVLAGGRLLQGLGGGALTVVSYVVVARLYPGALHPRVFAGFSAAWVIPSLVGPPVAGFVTERADWRWVFLGVAVLVPPIAAVVLARVRSVGPPEHPAPPEPGAEPVDDASTTSARRIGWAALAALAVLVLGVSGELSGAGTVAASLGGVAVALAALSRLVPPGTLRAARGLPAIVADRGLLAGAFFGAEVYLPYLLTRRYDVSPTFAGVTLTAAALTWAGAAWVQGRLGERLPHARAIRVGTVVVTLGIAGTGVGAATHAPIPVLVAAWAVAGFGMGLTYARQTVLVLRYSSGRAAGTNSSALSVSDSIGASLSLAVTGVLFAAFSARGGDAPYAACFALTSVLAAGAALVAVRVTPRVVSAPQDAAGSPTASSVART